MGLWPRRIELQKSYARKSRFYLHLRSLRHQRVRLKYSSTTQYVSRRFQIAISKRLKPFSPQDCLPALPIRKYKIGFHHFIRGADHNHSWETNKEIPGYYQYFKRYSRFFFNKNKLISSRLKIKFHIKQSTYQY